MSAATDVGSQQYISAALTQEEVWKIWYQTVCWFATYTWFPIIVSLEGSVFLICQYLYNWNCLKAAYLFSSLDTVFSCNLVFSERLRSYVNYVFPICVNHYVCFNYLILAWEWWRQWWHFLKGHYWWSVADKHVCHLQFLKNNQNGVLLI